MFFYILGKNQALSIAEVLNLHKTKKVVLGQDVLICDENLSEAKAIDNMGGVIKAGEIIKVTMPDVEKIKKWVIDYVLGLFNSGKVSNERKFQFGFSLYGLGDKYQTTLSKNLAMALKRALKEEGINSRWVISREKQLSSVIVEKNNLLIEKNGLELVFFLHENSLYVGQTWYVQDFEKYSELDYGRPARDSKSGMLPPKVAKILINLAGITREQTILDPFCGSGTILQEVLLLGYQNIIGNDISQRAIRDTKANLEWLEKKFPELKKSSVSLFNMPAEKLSGMIAANAVDAIITEPYLGPSRDFKGMEHGKIIGELSQLYLKAFHEFKKILKANGTVVMIWPIFNFEREIEFLPILNEVKKLGFEKTDLLPENISRDKNFDKNFWSFRGTIIYKREEQRVMREIIKFRKNV